MIRQKIKDAEKKQLRKAKQLFRKLTMAAYQSMNPNDSSETGNDAVWDDLEKMNDDVSEQKTFFRTMKKIVACDLAPNEHISFSH